MDKKTGHNNNDLDKERYIDEQWKLLKRSIDSVQKLLWDSQIEEITISRERISAKYNLLGGFMFALNIEDKRSCALETLNFGSYEKRDWFLVVGALKYIDEYKEKPVFYDVGANEGYYTVCASKLSGRIEIHAFEPVPNTLKWLQTNIRDNNIKGVIVNCIACSDSTGHSSFTYARQVSGSSGFVDLLELAGSETIEVETVTLDQYCKMHGRAPDLAKIDVEGAELKVIGGFADTLAKSSEKPILITEILRKWSRKYNYHANDLFQYICGLGYKGFIADIEHGFLACESIDERTMATNFMFVDKKMSFEKLEALRKKVLDTARRE